MVRVTVSRFRVGLEEQEKTTVCNINCCCFQSLQLYDFYLSSLTIFYLTYTWTDEWSWGDGDFIIITI